MACAPDRREIKSVRTPAATARKVTADDLWNGIERVGAGRRGRAHPPAGGRHKRRGRPDRAASYQLFSPARVAPVAHTCVPRCALPRNGHRRFAGCSEWHPGNAAGNSATGNEPRGRFQQPVRSPFPRMPDIFSAPPSAYQSPPPCLPA